MGKGGGSNEAKRRHWNVRLTELIKPLERSLAQTSFTGAESPLSELASWMPLRSQSTGCSICGKRSLHLKADTGMHFRAQQPGPISQRHSFICNLANAHGASTSIFTFCGLTAYRTSAESGSYLVKSRPEVCVTSRESPVLSVDVPLGILHAPDHGLCVVVMMVANGQCPQISSRHP